MVYDKAALVHVVKHRLQSVNVFGRHGGAAYGLYLARLWVYLADVERVVRILHAQHAACGGERLGREVALGAARLVSAQVAYALQAHGCGVEDVEVISLFVWVVHAFAH